MKLKENLFTHLKVLVDSEVNCSWSKKQQEAAWFAINQDIPTVKNEEWKYTNLRHISQSDYGLIATPSIVPGKLVKKLKGLQTDFYVITIVNGFLNKELSTFPTDEALKIVSLNEGFRLYPEVFMQHFARLAPDSTDFFTSVNTALGNKGLFIWAKKGVNLEKPIRIIYLQESEQPQITLIRNLVIVDKEADLSIIEDFRNDGKANLLNRVNEIVINENGKLTRTLLQIDCENLSAIASTYIEQKANSQFNSYTFSWSGALLRNNLEAVHVGSNCETYFNGAYLPNGNQLIDNHTLVDHATPHCQSYEHYKGILSGNAKGVFNGKVMVRPQAQKTNAFQSNNNIVLGDSAQIFAKPQLEIFADDVKCSHGATVGQLNQQEIFYLMSRGIGAKEAKRLLLEAFIAEIAMKIPNEALQIETQASLGFHLNNMV